MNSVSCIKILSPQEVQQMGKDGVDLLNGAPNRRIQSRKSGDYLNNGVAPSVGSLDY